MSKRPRREKPCVECDGLPPRESPAPARFQPSGQEWTVKEAPELEEAIGEMPQALGGYPDHVELVRGPDGIPTGIRPPGIVADIVASDAVLLAPHIMWVIFLAKRAVCALPPENLTAAQVKTWLIVQFDAFFSSEHGGCMGLLEFPPTESSRFNLYFLLQAAYLKAFSIRKRYEGRLFVDALYVPPDRRKDFEALRAIGGMSAEQIERMAQALREK